MLALGTHPNVHVDALRGKYPALQPVAYGPLLGWADFRPASFIGQVPDRTGNGRNSTTNGITTTATFLSDLVPGRLAWAPRLENQGATNGPIRAGDSALIIRGEITITLRAQFTNFNDGRVPLFSFGAQGETEATNILYQLSYQWNYVITGGGRPGWLEYLCEYGAGVNETCGTSSTTVVPWGWVFVSLRRDNNGNVTIGVNDTFHQFNGLNPPTGGENGSLYVGRNADNTQFRGALADFMLWDKRLTDDEVIAQYKVAMGL